MKSCLHCGCEFQPVRSTKTFCSPKCGKAHWQKNHVAYSRAANKKSYRKHNVARRAAARGDERKRAYMKDYYARNREHILELDRRRKAVIREQRCAYMADYNARPDVQARMHAYRVTNRKRLAESHRQWKAAHPDRIRDLWSQNHNRRRAKIAAVTTEPVSRIAILKRDKWKCQLCGCRTPQRLLGTHEPNAPTLDHIIPLAKGGGHSPDNLQCACWTCNTSKRDRIRGQFRIPLGSA